MSQDGGQPRQAGGDVSAVAVPASQRVHGEGVPQGVDAGTAPSGPGTEARPGDQAGEGLVDAVVGEAAAGAGDQQRRGGPRGEQVVAAALVAGERGERCGWSGTRRKLCALSWRTISMPSLVSMSLSSSAIASLILSPVTISSAMRVV